MEEVDSRLQKLAEEMAVEAVKMGYTIKVIIEPLVDSRAIDAVRSTQLMQDAQKSLMQALENGGQNFMNPDMGIKM